MIRTSQYLLITILMIFFFVAGSKKISNKYSLIQKSNNNARNKNNSKITSCQVTFNNTTLEKLCQKPYSYNSWNLHNIISNNNGKLEYNSNGNYDSSCNMCTLKSNTLTCRCKTRVQSWVSAQISLINLTK